MGAPQSESAGIKRLAGWVNKKLEVVKQIKDKLKKDKVSSSEMKEMISSLMEILRTIKSILNFFCSFGSEETKNEFQAMLDKATAELERINESPIQSDDDGVRQRLIEICENIQSLLEAIQKFCIFAQLSSVPTDGSDDSIRGITKSLDASGGERVLQLAWCVAVMPHVRPLRIRSSFPLLLRWQRRP